MCAILVLANSMYAVHRLSSLTLYGCCASGAVMAVCKFGTASMCLLCASVCRAGEDYALLLDMQNMNLNNNSQAQHASTHVQVEEEPPRPAAPELAVLQLELHGAGSSSCHDQSQQLLQPVEQQQQQQGVATAEEPCQSTIPGDISWKQLLQAEAPALQQQQQQQEQQQGLDQQLSIHKGAVGQQRRSYSICSSGSGSSGSEAGNNNGSLEQLEVAMKQALSPSSGAASFLPAHGSLHSQVGYV
jgi:hypothetical protein